MREGESCGNCLYCNHRFDCCRHAPVGYADVADDGEKFVNYGFPAALQWCGDWEKEMDENR